MTTNVAESEGAFSAIARSFAESCESGSMSRPKDDEIALAFGRQVEDIPAIRWELVQAGLVTSVEVYQHPDTGIKRVGPRDGAPPDRDHAQVLHGCRQLVS
jgi:hypothetical protein